MQNLTNIAHFATLAQNRLDGVDEPSDADLSALEAEVVSEDTDWESLLEPVLTVKTVDEDYWAEDENVHDDRYDGDGIPKWSAWA